MLPELMLYNHAGQLARNFRRQLLQFLLLLQRPGRVADDQITEREVVIVGRLVWVKTNCSLMKRYRLFGAAGLRQSHRVAIATEIVVRLIAHQNAEDELRIFQIAESPVGDTGIVASAQQWRIEHHCPAESGQRTIVLLRLAQGLA